VADKPEPLDPRSREKILAAYDRAKMHNPKLSSGDFMWEVPTMRERFKSKESAGAYLRVLKQGRRTGGVLYREASQPGQRGMYQVIFTTPDGKKAYSQDLTVAGGESEFDIAAIETELKQPTAQRHLGAVIDKWRAKYGFSQNAMRASRFRVRQVRKQSVKRTYRIGI
jgi:hypothetical protein